MPAATSPRCSPSAGKRPLRYWAAEELETATVSTKSTSRAAATAVPGRAPRFLRTIS